MTEALISDCMEIDPASRPTASILVQRVSAQSLLSCMYCMALAEEQLKLQGGHSGHQAQCWMLHRLPPSALRHTEKGSHTPAWLHDWPLLTWSPRGLLLPGP